MTAYERCCHNYREMASYCHRQKSKQLLIRDDVILAEKRADDCVILAYTHVTLVEMKIENSCLVDIISVIFDDWDSTSDIQVETKLKIGRFVESS